MIFHIDIFRLILDYYSQHPPPWVDNLPPTAKRRKTNDHDIKIVEEVLKLLTLAAEHFRSLWNWSEFATYYLNHHDSYVVWYCILK